MHILSIDTAMGVESCAIIENGNIKTFSKGTENSLQAEKLFSHIEKTLSESKLKLADIDYFAINLGPGSFTGIRTGLSAVLAMSFALNKKVIGVSSLEACAYNIRKEKKETLVVALDAGREMVYYQEFKNHNNFVMEYSNAELVAVEKLIMADIGNLKECKTKFIPDATIIAHCASAKLKYEIVDFDLKSPIYIRQPDAVVKGF